jgi:hypothetical protein
VAFPHNDLISRVRCGGLNFERFVEILETRGYITEANNEEGCSPASPIMEAARQEDFDRLFVFFFPRRPNNITLACIASNEGFEIYGPGALSYALFNSEVLDESEVRRILARVNRAVAEKLGPEPVTL